MGTMTRRPPYFGFSVEIGSKATAPVKQAGPLIGQSQSNDAALSARADGVTDRALDVATVLREAGEKAGGEGDALPTLASHAAGQIEWASRYVRSRSVGELVRAVERFARKRPLIFLGGTFALGLLGARLLMGSARPAHPKRGHEVEDLRAAHGRLNRRDAKQAEEAKKKDQLLGGLVSRRLAAPLGTLQIHVRKFLWEGACHQRVFIKNYGVSATEGALSFHFAAELAHIFEVRGCHGGHAGTTSTRPSSRHR